MCRAMDEYREKIGQDVIIKLILQNAEKGLDAMQISTFLGVEEGYVSDVMSRMSMN